MAHISYPFNGMGGRVIAGYDSREAAEALEATLWNEGVELL
jgi:hypothetical protein